MSESPQKEPAPEDRYLKKMVGIIKSGTLDSLALKRHHAERITWSHLERNERRIHSRAANGL